MAPLTEMNHKYYFNFLLLVPVNYNLLSTENLILSFNMSYSPVPVAARSKAWVCGRSPAEIVGSNPTGGMDVCLL